MCEHGDTVDLWLPSEATNGWRFRSVDRCIAPLVAALRAAGFETVASCCGHGNRPGSIALRDGREVIIAPDFDSARRIDALFPTITGEVLRVLRDQSVIVSQDAKVWKMIDDYRNAPSATMGADPSGGQP